MCFQVAEDACAAHCPGRITKRWARGTLAPTPAAWAATRRPRCSRPRLSGRWGAGEQAVLLIVDAWTCARVFPKIDLLGRQALVHGVLRGTSAGASTAAKARCRRLLAEGCVGTNVPPSMLPAQVMEQLIYPTARGMCAEGTPFRGVIFAGLMIKDGQVGGGALRRLLCRAWMPAPCQGCLHRRACCIRLGWVRLVTDPGMHMQSKLPTMLSTTPAHPKVTNPPPPPLPPARPSCWSTTCGLATPSASRSWCGCRATCWRACRRSAAARR